MNVDRSRCARQLAALERALCIRLIPVRGLRRRQVGDGVALLLAQRAQSSGERGERHEQRDDVRRLRRALLQLAGEDRILERKAALGKLSIDEYCTRELSHRQSRLDEIAANRVGSDGVRDLHCSDVSM